MVDHIYGRINVLNSVPRPNMFVNELNLYLEYLKNESGKYMDNITTQQSRYLRTFQTNLMAGIEYYRKLATELKLNATVLLEEMTEELKEMEMILLDIPIPLVEVVK